MFTKTDLNNKRNWVKFVVNQLFQKYQMLINQEIHNIKVKKILMLKTINKTIRKVWVLIKPSLLIR